MTRTPDSTFQAAAREVLVAEIDAHRPAPHAARSAEPGLRELVRIALVTLVVGATVTAAWLGITAFQHRDRPAPAVTSDGTATTSPTTGTSASPAVDPVEASIRDVVGRGRLTGAITGDFTIRYDGYNGRVPQLVLTDLDVGSSKARQVLLAVDLASATCRSDSTGYLAGTITTKRTQTVDVDEASPQDLSDLSYLHGLAIWTQEGCENGSVAGAGAITWTLPKTILDLARTDLGARAAARGDVATVAGRPNRYTVEADDQLPAVAARFGMTAEDLLYLNPLRRRGSDTRLYVGEQLNLNPLTRDWFWR